MARKKQEIILENVVIEAVAAEGKALAKVDGAVLFVQFAQSMFDVAYRSYRRLERYGIYHKKLSAY